MEGSTWIPEDAAKHNLSILILSHCGLADHCGEAARENLVKETFWWEGHRQDVHEFAIGCTRCIGCSTEERVPQPMGTALHGKESNEVVHMDFLFLRKLRMQNYIFVHPEGQSQRVRLAGSPRRS